MSGTQTNFSSPLKYRTPLFFSFVRRTMNLEIKNCRQCAAPARYICSRCFDAVFCGTECQLEDWNSGENKHVCFSLTQGSFILGEGRKLEDVINTTFSNRYDPRVNLLRKKYTSGFRRIFRGPEPYTVQFIDVNQNILKTVSEGNNENITFEKMRTLLKYQENNSPYTGNFIIVSIDTLGMIFSDSFNEETSSITAKVSIPSLSALTANVFKTVIDPVFEAIDEDFQKVIDKRKLQALQVLRDQFWSTKEQFRNKDAVDVLKTGVSFLNYDTDNPTATSDFKIALNKDNKLIAMKTFPVVLADVLYVFSNVVNSQVILVTSVPFPSALTDKQRDTVELISERL